MQLNKQGQIVNPPQYLINGAERRKLKGELSKLRQIYKMFWFYEDINDVYGCAMPKQDAQRKYEELAGEIKEMERRLEKPNIDLI